MSDNERMVLVTVEFTQEYFIEVPASVFLDDSKCSTEECGCYNGATHDYLDRAIADYTGDIGETRIVLTNVEEIK